MKINQKKIDAILALSGAKRYEHFIKVITDWEEVWGLYHDGGHLLQQVMREFFRYGLQKNMQYYVPLKNGLVISQSL
ncbi:MAG: hypothetical protein ACU85E_10020 [Gammaproteobacteria bacterium]